MNDLRKSQFDVKHMQRANDRQVIEFRTQISIHYEECPALWDLFERMPVSRRSAAISAMLARLITLEKALGVSVYAPPVAASAAVAVGAGLPPALVHAADQDVVQPQMGGAVGTTVPEESAAVAEKGIDDGVENLLHAFGVGGLDTFLSYD